MSVSMSVSVSVFVSVSLAWEQGHGQAQADTSPQALPDQQRSSLVFPVLRWIPNSTFLIASCVRVGLPTQDRRQKELGSASRKCSIFREWASTPAWVQSFSISTGADPSRRARIPACWERPALSTLSHHTDGMVQYQPAWNNLTPLRHAALTETSFKYQPAGNGSCVHPPTQCSGK